MTLVIGADSSTQSCKVLVMDAVKSAVICTGRAAHPDWYFGESGCVVGGPACRNRRCGWPR